MFAVGSAPTGPNATAGPAVTAMPTATDKSLTPIGDRTVCIMEHWVSQRADSAERLREEATP
jgi:hypothetical protein